MSPEVIGTVAAVSSGSRSRSGRCVIAAGGFAFLVALGAVRHVRRWVG